MRFCAEVEILSCLLDVSNKRLLPFRRKEPPCEEDTLEQANVLKGSVAPLRLEGAEAIQTHT
jgi:hypothetical protein